MSIHKEIVRFSSCLFFLLVLLNHTDSIAQISKIDSLSNSLQQETEDSNKVDILLTLSFANYQIDISKCREFAEKALKISEEINDTNRIALSYNCLGIAFDLEGNSSQAINYWERCLALSERTNFLVGKMKSLNNLGLAHKEKGNIKKSLEFFLASIEIDEVIGNEKQYVNTLSNIGYLYLSLDDTEHALLYLEQAIEKGEKMDDASVLSHPYQRMGEYYVRIKDYESGLLYLNKAYSICQEYAHDLRAATILRLMGECKYYQGQGDSGFELFYEAENRLNKIGENYTEKFTLYQTWATVYSDLGDDARAFEKAHKGYALAKESKLESSILSSLQLLGQLNEKIANHEEALRYFRAASAQQDSMHLRSKEELLLDLETKYQTDKKEVENKLLRTQQEITQARLKTTYALMAAIFLCLILFGIVAFLLFRANKNKQQYNEELQSQVAERTTDLESSNSQLIRSNSELERFAFIASHDLKTPLRNIISFTGLLERHLGDHNDARIHEYFRFLKEGGKRMNSLIDDVLQYSRLSGPTEEIINEKIDLNLLCKELANTLNGIPEYSHGKLKVTNTLPTIKSNYSSIFLLFQNLIENGMKYNESSNPEVMIHCENDTDSFSIFFEDNGIGINEEFFDKIWEMFARLHNHAEYEGTGLGLATCKKIMDSLKGSIELSSTLGKGSVFQLKFPNTILV